MSVRNVPPASIKRTYPHVDEVEDWRAGQTIRLLWDRIHSFEERLQAAQATITNLVSGHNSLETTVGEVGKDARQALTSVQGGGGSFFAGGSGTGGGGGGEELPGGGDDGGGNKGCQSAGANGHDSGGLLTAHRAGQIICGTSHEFPNLTGATTTAEERETNAIELLRRMIWHLKQAGFSAGRQQNPSKAISGDKLTVVTESVLRAYDVFADSSNFLAPMSTHMVEVAPPVMVDDAGIPD